MNCEFCDIPDYIGKEFDKCMNIDGGKQDFQVYIFDSPEDEGRVLVINGASTEIRIEINFCPMCGRKI
jgi:hypothetical protein